MASQLIERAAYGGRYLITHNPFAKGSQPRYTVADTSTGIITKPQGVTTKISGVLAKDLTGWALDCMQDAILAAMNRRAAMDDEPLTEEDVAEAKLEASRRRTDGASVGSETHSMIEHYLKGEEVKMSKIFPGTVNAFGAFIRWFDDVNPRVLASEQVIYHPDLVYAGTYDALVEINGKVYMVDFKTTNTSRKAPQGIYPENFIQLGAYFLAHMYENPLETVDGVMVVSVRKDGKLDIVTNDDLGLSLTHLAQYFVTVCDLGDFMDDVTTKLGRK